MGSAAPSSVSHLRFGGDHRLPLTSCTPEFSRLVLTCLHSSICSLPQSIHHIWLTHPQAVVETDSRPRVLLPNRTLNSMFLDRTLLHFAVLPMSSSPVLAGTLVRARTLLLDVLKHLNPKICRNCQFLPHSFHPSTHTLFLFWDNRRASSTMYLWRQKHKV